MKIHKIKILGKYADDVFHRKKTFEIRRNDRDYQVGDIILFEAIDADFKDKQHPLNFGVWQITYILKNFEGIQKGFVAMSIKELTAFEILQIAKKLYG